MPNTSAHTAAVCVGCLGNRECWVCLGEGSHESRDGRSRGPDCTRCRSTGRCPLCCDIGVPARPHPLVRPPLISLAAF